MPESLQIRVIEDGTPKVEGPLTGPLEIGRQMADEAKPYARVAATAGSPARLVIARQEDRDNFSRHHVLLEPLASGHVRTTNRSRVPLSCDAVPGGQIAPENAVELAPPFALELPGRRTIVITPGGPPDPAGLHSLDQQTVGPGRLADLSRRLRSLPTLSTPQLDALVGWLHTTMGVLQASVGAADFLEKAAQALVQIVGLDLGRVLLLEGDEWVVRATHGAEPDDSLPWHPSRRVLQHVRDKRKTFWQAGPAAASAEAPSLEPLETVVAAPILNADEEVIGALYGERRRAPAAPLHASGKLEATLVELLACGVAAGLARQEQEMAALEAHVRFEQFFGPEVARRLVRDPSLLEARHAAVTVLFCDVRGFSRLSEKLGPADTIRWMNDVMDEVSGRVFDERGVVVDYVGDEVMAMWGVPEDQPDQAARATRAALAMLAALPAINRRWQQALGGPTELGIGINSGPAQVGNTGSRFKYKYGPHGNTVNLASRVQGLTKYLKCPLLVTRATREQIGDGFIARRVVKTRVVNIEGPVELYEVEPAGSEERRQFFAESEAALDALEAGDFTHAAHKAGTLVLGHRGDGPVLLTLSRASAAMIQDGRGFHPVWEPPGK
jgi:adenylate cyclase